MSTPAKEGAAPATLEKRGSFNKYLTRMKTVLKRSDSASKRQSFHGKETTPAASSSVVRPRTAIEEQEEESIPIVKPESRDGMTKKKLMRSEVHAERTKKLGERFAMVVDPVPMANDIEVYRVEKEIRMRIHRSCHKCDTAFGPRKVCKNCQHNRCKSCPRYPVKGYGLHGKGKEILSDDYVEPEDYWNLKEDIVLTLPSRRPGGQPLVRKQPKQRIRRNCHECSALFVGKSKECASCGHIRCTDCPRDPAKKSKYPDGYPGDAFSSDTTKPIKYACSDCNKVFPPVPHPESEEGKALEADPSTPKQKCVRCGHERCSKCRRALPRRVEPTADPDVLKSIEAKIASLCVTA